MIVTIGDLQKRAVFYAVILLWASVLLVGLLGVVLDKGGLAEAGLMAVIAGLVTFESKRNGAALGVQMAASAGLAIAVSVIVYQMRGHPWQPDSHMIFFAAFALTAVFCDWRPIVTYAAVIAVHHLVLNFTLTEAVFPGEASFGRVLLHAVVLIVQAVPLIWLSTVLAGMFAGSDKMVAEAQDAQQRAQVYAAQQQTEQEHSRTVVEVMEQALLQLSDGDLNTTLSDTALPPGYGTMQAAFNTTVSALAKMIGEVEAGAKGLMQSSDALAAAAQLSADRADQQSGSVEDSSRAMIQLADGVKATAHLAMQADAMMAANRHEAQSSGEVLVQAVSAMKKIEESSNQISRISEVMGDIAFQTNLLALNAGVEAARAGELGRGFAVVASEVRELAQRAEVATKEIRVLVEDSRKNVTKGADLVGKTSVSLGTLINGASGAAEIVANIATKMREQTSELDALSQNIKVMEDTARAGASVAKQSSNLGATLKQEANGMIAAVAAFHGSSGHGSSGHGSSGHGSSGDGSSGHGSTYGTAGHGTAGHGGAGQRRAGASARRDWAAE